MRGMRGGAGGASLKIGQKEATFSSKVSGERSQKLGRSNPWEDSLRKEN